MAPGTDARARAITGGRILSWIGAHREALAALAGMIILGLALIALSGLLHEIRGGDIKRAISAIETRSWALAIGFTAVSYFCLTLYDFVALRVIGAPIAYPVAARAAATSYAISNTLGLSLLTGGSVRMRIYGRAGLGEGDVARVVALAAATFWSGIFVLFAIALAFEPAEIRLGAWVVPAGARWGLSFFILAALAGVLAWIARKRRTLRLFGASLPVPTAGQMIVQLAVAGIDLAASAAVIFVLVPGLTAEVYPQLLAAYVLALGIAVLTHSPGGLGVFETMVFLLLPQIDKSGLAAALIGYRLVYYMLPFSLALVALAFGEGKELHRRVAPVARFGQAVAVSLAPVAMAGLVFAGGALLILTGAFPAIPERVQVIVSIAPPMLLDLSHLAASLLGTALMFVAYGLYRRLDIAWLAAMSLLVLGSLAALLRGLDFEEAGMLACVTTLLAWTRPAFYRQSALTSERPSPAWLLAIGTVLVTSLFAGLFAYKNVEYRDELWWQVHPAGDTARFLRATLGVGVVAFVLALNRLSRPYTDPAATELDPRIWQSALANCTRTEAHLARTGDKAFLTSQDGDAFLMYRVRGRSFIAMSDPVGPPARWPELAWQLRELADRQGGRVAFYECGAEFLPIAVDLGLGIMKLGEEALVPLGDFSLDGKTRANLRHAINRMDREGVTFRLIEGEDIPDLMAELREISDEWLTAKHQREKQFSVGRFEDAYLLGGPIALVERNGRIEAFANLWTLPGRQELSFDLMRHREDALPGTMDFLFARLMLWGKEHGYQRLSLGVAPLSGIQSRRLAPIWARIAGAVFRHGERLYGYSGLRQYKEKFRPEWRGRYFAAPHGLGMARALIDVTLLVSAGAAKPSPPDSATGPESRAAGRVWSRAAHREGDPASVASPISRIPSEG